MNKTEMSAHLPRISQTAARLIVPLLFALTIASPGKVVAQGGYDFDPTTCSIVRPGETVIQALTDANGGTPPPPIFRNTDMWALLDHSNGDGSITRYVDTVHRIYSGNSPMNMAFPGDLACVSSSPYELQNLPVSNP